MFDRLRYYVPFILLLYSLLDKVRGYLKPLISVYEWE